MRYYAVSDIHGHFTELKEALEESGFFADKQPRKLIVCGDLFDRGRQILQTQDFILELLERDEVILVRGNHEDLFCELLDDIKRVMTYEVYQNSHWTNGTVGALLELTGYDLTRACAEPLACAEKARNTPFMKVILPKMKDYFETKKYIFVHGWIPCSYLGQEKFVYADNWRELGYDYWRDARWLNGMLAAKEGVVEPNKMIICGHHNCSYGHAVLEGRGSERGADADFTPYYGKGVIAIDACTEVSHKVNCIVLEDD